MTNGDKSFTENILLHSVPIYIPDNDQILTFTRPKGLYSYMFSTAKDPVNKDEYKAIEIQIVSTSFGGKTMRHLKIVNEPQLGSLENDRKFCNSMFDDVKGKKQTQGLCFGNEECCDAFEYNILNMPPQSGYKCRKV